MLDHVRRVRDDARHQELPLRQLHVLPDGPFISYLHARRAHSEWRRPAGSTIR
jgi:hypothetical protein